MKSRKIFTLVLLLQQPKILLGYKKRGFGVGKWNGFGGKVEEGETVAVGAARELEEESGIKVSNSGLIRCGFIQMDFTNNSQQPLDIHVFRCSSFEGQPIETEEMRPQWFDIEDIPYSQMWEEASLWFPVFLRGSYFNAHFMFEETGRILKHSINEVENIE